MAPLGSMSRPVVDSPRNGNQQLPPSPQGQTHHDENRIGVMNSGIVGAS
jgi:hypothetical protein